MFDKLIDLIKQFGRFFVVWYILDPYNGALIIRLGKVLKKAKPGWNWLAPFMIDMILECNVKTHTLNVGPQSLMTKDGKQVVISTVITCTVEDVEPFLLQVNGGMTALDDAATGVVSRLVMEHTLEELHAMDIANELTKDVRRFAKPWGVGITRVQLSDFTVMRSIRMLMSQNHLYPDRKEF